MSASTGFTPLSTIRRTMDKAVNDKCKSKLRVKNIENLTLLLHTFFTNECHIEQVRLQQCATFHRDRALARIAAIEAENGWGVGAAPGVAVQQQQSASNSVNVVVNVATSGGGGEGASHQAVPRSSRSFLACACRPPRLPRAASTAGARSWTTSRRP